MSDAMNELHDEQPFKELVELSPDTPVAPAHGIAAIALHMAMKYHDMNMVKDGALYQQYKLEGRNMMPLNLDRCFETAIKIERHLLGASDRIAKVIVDALAVVVEDDEEQQPVGDDSSAPDTTA